MFLLKIFINIFCVSHFVEFPNQRRLFTFHWGYLFVVYRLLGRRIINFTLLCRCSFSLVR